MRALRFVAPLALALALPALAGDTQDSGKRIFWKVTSDKGTDVYLLGSVHVATEDMYPLPKEIEEAYKKSAALAVEADIDAGDPAEIQQLVMGKGMYQGEDTLEKHVSKETMKKVEEKLPDMGLPVETAKKLKPWLLAMQIEQLNIQKMGMSAELGIDHHFLKKAHKKSKTIHELEGVKFQLDLLSGLSEDEQDKFLASTLDEQDKAKEQLEAIVDAWKTGDDKKMAELAEKGIKEHPESKPVMKKLIDDRNVGMTKKVEEWLAGKDSVFVVVGSMHLVGDNGVVKLLEKTGKYKIEQVKTSPPAKKKEPAESGAK